MRQLRKDRFRGQVIKFDHESFKMIDDHADAVAECFRLMKDWEVPDLKAQLQMEADRVRLGNMSIEEFYSYHTHTGMDNPFITTGGGEIFMDSRYIGSSARGLHATKSVVGTIDGVKPNWFLTVDSVKRDCPPNKVITYTQRIWNIAKSARDNLAEMVINDYYKLSGKSVVQILENATPERFDIEVWFEDDRNFHIYQDDKRIFESNSAKATAAFIEGGLK